ncbi:MAG: 4-hydroxythreonine-4-phosphate dehydrogenase PdxA, partial [Bacteroidetes bacterium]
MNKLPIIGITVGDINGIGPEIVIKALADQRILDFCIPVVYGSPKLISYWKKAIGLVDFNLHLIKSLDQIHTKRPNLLVCWEEDVEIKPGDDNEIGGKYALKSLEMAAKDVKEGKIHALVTAPLNKHNVNSSLLPFKGHTEYLAQIDGTNNYMMMLVAEKMKVGLVTGHIPLKDVASKISEELIVQKIKALQNSLQKDIEVLLRTYQKPKKARGIEKDFINI